MKKLNKLLAGFLALLLVVTGLPLYGIKIQAAETLTEGNYQYEVNENGNSVKITKYTRNGGDANIPSEIDGKSVTSIGQDAFWGCNGLISITIPDSVISIGQGVFYDCSSLESVAIPDSVASIGHGAFEHCSGLESIVVAKENTVYDSREDCNAIIATESNTLIAGCINTIIPDGATSIGYAAFSNCSGLTGIAIPDSVTSIGEYAFGGCSGLTGIAIPDNVTSIGDSAFFGCSGLTGIAISGSVTSIGEHAFGGCSNLVDVTILDGVASIGAYAFYGCSGLTGIAIPDSVTSIGQGAFEDCYCLESIAIPNSVISIGQGAFSKCVNLASATIPNSVSSIESRAFFGCSSLRSITLPDSVTSIGNKAFGYIYNGALKEDKPILYFTIYGKIGSIAENYARENHFSFIGVDGTSGNETLQADISQAAITLEKDSYVYDGIAKAPSVTVTLDRKTLILDTDYTVFYSGNTNVGTAVVTITGKGNYKGSVIKTFTIVESNSSSENNSSLESNGSSGNSGSSGNNGSPGSNGSSGNNASMGNNGSPESNGSSGNSGSSGNNASMENSGSSGNNAFSGNSGSSGNDGSSGNSGSSGNNGSLGNSNSKQHITYKKKIYRVAYGARPFKLNVTSGGSLTYQSSNRKVAAVGKTNGKVTIKGTGIAYITAKTKTDSVKITIKVSPKSPAVKSLRPGRGRKLAVKWTKDKRATGYQIQVSAVKNFKKTVKKQKAVKSSCTFKGLKVGKKYYIRLRSYKKSGKSTLYSAWSSPKQSGKIKR